ncbi:hypothetical protein [Mycolicibacterium aichiense]|uniref:Uncharacterized protein n=1 Tax=Mycolicibacterium aichiense TaxID=1799 RepID=A0AAD1HR77_9MYCO|nr:hypothetical protein [Mycolicibacterium aichiense]MCV7016744.1 hypothetical protein [Mycolicibacterium aichiense]QFG08048.1 hypothetical protein SEA_HERBERTWM_82 [Mycobacterium phage Herbertwm]BBX09474.1 hypothetical protein MAIC_42770 [Mycolicibacterium aichiense]SUA14039.1 Uncharacterised protein [Mycolicibacterium aichiense]
MTITTSVNQAKDDLDVALGEARRLDLLLPPLLSDLQRYVGSDNELAVIAHAVDTIHAKLRKVRASL